MRRSALLLWSGIVYAITPGAFAITLGDDFTVSHDYLANGVSGTMWDGIYTGAGSFPGGNTGAGPGSTLLADANISGAGRLTVQSVYTGWENTDDDGFFLFKNVAGDFQMSVHVVSPFSNTPYNNAGLLVRAAGAGGSPFNGAENHLSITRVDEFGVGNWIRNTTNGSSIQMTQPSDANYWLRIDRVNGTTFNFYEKAADSDPWQLIANSTVDRSDFAGLTLQVGIEQASYIGNTNQAQFDTFRLTVVPEPMPIALAFAAGTVAISFRRFTRRDR